MFDGKKIMIIHPKNETWLDLILTIKGTILTRIWKRVLATTLLAIFVTIVHLNYGWFSWSLTALPFSFIGLALSIFLGFRNNTSYDRFWEGRKLWGSLVNTSRSLGRQTQIYVHGAADTQQIHKKIVYSLVAYVHSLRMHLRDEKDYDSLNPYLHKAITKSLASQSNPPMSILYWISHLLGHSYRQGHIDAYHVAMLEERVTELTNIQGGCERIKSTPIPFSYVVLLHRIAAFYCFALPFGICDQVGYLTPLVVFMVSYAFLGLDAIGDEIEDPFGKDLGDLPLGYLSTMIEVNIRQQLGETDLPDLPQPVRDVLS